MTSVAQDQEREKLAKIEARRVWRDLEREQRRRERRCFWTFPFGHRYYLHTCLDCGRVEEPWKW